MTEIKPLRIVIIGRPNVGKSTLFNRLLGRRRALVHDLPGVTRDRLEEHAEWMVKGHSVPVILTDTGGLGAGDFSAEIAHQVGLAVSVADIVLVLFDVQSGLTPGDQEVIEQLNRSGIMSRNKGRAVSVLGVVNKVDADCHESAYGEFYETGLENIVTVSAEHGRGIDDLQEQILSAFSLEDYPRRKGKDSNEEKELNSEDEKEFEQKIPRIAIVGRPNVGKSTLINALLSEERMITSPIAGTTVDAVDSLVELNDHKFLFIDTAGIRRKSKTEQGVEVLSVVQARKALERSDVAILVLDGETGITDQDEKIGGMIEKVGCSVILALNKWDTQRNNRKFTKEEAAEQIRNKMAYLKYAPILFLSAKRGEGFEDLGDLIHEIMNQRKTKILTHEFTEWVRQEAPIHNPMNAKFYLCHQAGKYPPTFVCHVNDPDKVHFSLKRHLINALRERWGFMGTPVRMLFVSDPTRTKRYKT